MNSEVCFVLVWIINFLSCDLPDIYTHVITHAHDMTITMTATVQAKPKIMAMQLFR